MTDLFNDIFLWFLTFTVYRYYYHNNNYYSQCLNLTSKILFSKFKIILFVFFLALKVFPDLSVFLEYFL